MESSNPCLENIVGITPKECDCFTEDLTASEESVDVDWYKKSTSGFFVHELEGVISMNAVRDAIGTCEQLADFYLTTIKNSIRETGDDISASINERYKKKETNFVGFVGARSSSKGLVLNGDYAGLKLIVNETSGAVIVIKALGIMMTTTEDFSIQIYRRYVETDLYELVDTIEGVSSVANSYSLNALADPIFLEMDIENEGQLEYYLLYQRNGMQPRNNLASCGCGRKEHQLKKLLNYGGVDGNDLDEMGSWGLSTYGNGIVLDAEVRCNAETIICKMFSASPEWGKYVAHAVLYKMAFKIHKKLLSSNNVTQEVLANREQVDANMRDFESEYWSRIKYLVQNVDLRLNDCYVCDNRKLKVSQILL